MRLRDFHIKRCIICNGIVWQTIDAMILYCFDKSEMVIHAGKCLELWDIQYKPNYRGCP